MLYRRYAHLTAVNVPSSFLAPTPINVPALLQNNATRYYSCSSGPVSLCLLWGRKNTCIVHFNTEDPLPNTKYFFIRNARHSRRERYKDSEQVKREMVAESDLRPTIYGTPHTKLKNAWTFKWSKDIYSKRLKGWEHVTAKRAEIPYIKSSTFQTCYSEGKF